VLRYLFLFTFLFSFNISADLFISSPKIKVNNQNQRIIEFRVNNERIIDGDIVLNEYKTNNPINDSFLEYSLINDFGTYQTFTIVLAEEYSEDYFSLRIKIKEKYSKDIFVFLPSKIREKNTIESSTVYKTETTSSKITNDIKSLIRENDQIDSNKIFKSSEITTVWSMAKIIKGDNTNISIYQVMWSIYLGNRDAFIEDNINLIRKDLDIFIPSMNEIENISYQIARDSIINMNESFSNSLNSAAKSLLVLTAPKINENLKIRQDTNLADEVQEQINFVDPLDPKTLIEQNTKQINLEFENQVLDKLIEENNKTSYQNKNEFKIFDLVFISLISLVSGILLALIYIQIRNMRASKEIEYDFEEALDNDSSSSSLPPGLSIKNDEDQQEFDLAVTYFEMNDKENAKSLLKNLIKKTQNVQIKEASIDLFEKLKKL